MMEGPYLHDIRNWNRFAASSKTRSHDALLGTFHDLWVLEINGLILRELIN